MNTAHTLISGFDASLRMSADPRVLWSHTARVGVNTLAQAPHPAGADTLPGRTNYGPSTALPDSLIDALKTLAQVSDKGYTKMLSLVKRIRFNLLIYQLVMKHCYCMKEGDHVLQMRNVYDYIILGAGPSGLQLGYFFECERRNYIILEAGDAPGSFFRQFPRHGKLISINKIYTGYEQSEINLRWDWNALLCDEGMPFKAYSRDYFPPREALVHYLGDFAARFHLQVQYGTHVRHITRDTVFQLQDTQGKRYQCQRLIVATGVSKPYIPPIPGIEHAELYTDMSVNPDDFVNQRVLIIGKGNSAFETADNLISTAALIHLVSPHPITMAWKSHYVGHLRAVNNNFLDTYQLKSQNAIVDATLERIEYIHGQYHVSFGCTHASGEREELRYDRVIVCTGFRFDASLFDETCRPRLAINKRFPAQTSAWESTNVQDLYFAGTLMQMRDYKRSASGFIHGFRYNVRALARILAHRYHGEPWPSRPINRDAVSLVDYVIARVNKTSSLWQQFGFLCDVIVLADHAQQAQCYEDIPVDYVHDTECAHNHCYYTITLEYGSYYVNDPFHVERPHSHDADKADQSYFLHPIIRRFDCSQLVSEHHIMEALETRWNEDFHINPLMRYFQRELLIMQDYNKAA